MTEKRFYYNVFYHRDDMSRVLEYEIIDRQSYPNYPNHDEKEDIQQWYIYISENDSGWQDMLVDLLNELHEENQYLKSLKWNQDCINEISIGMQQRQLLEEENEQLKKDVEYWKQVASQYSNELNVFEHCKKYKTECKDIHWSSD